MREQQGGRGGGASFPLDAFEGISASRAEPYRHVRVMRVMGFLRSRTTARSGGCFGGNHKLLG